MTNEEALTIVLFAFHGEEPPERLTSAQIIEATNSPEARRQLARLQIRAEVLDSFADEHLAAARVGQALSRHVNAYPAGQRTIDRPAAGQWRLGPKAGARLAELFPDLKHTSNTTMRGLVGEFAVMSELFAREWNVSKPVVDDGVDLIATRRGQVRTFQVKTATRSGLQAQSFSFSIRSAAHDLYTGISHYYVLVLRELVGAGWRNSFLVLPSNEIGPLLNRFGKTSDRTSDQVGMTISRDTKGRYLIEGNGGSSDVTHKLNRFGPDLDL
jgi:hypothetical protein